MSACGATLRSTPTAARAAVRRVEGTKLVTRRPSLTSSAVKTMLAVRSNSGITSTRRVTNPMTMPVTCIVTISRFIAGVSHGESAP